MYQSVSSDRGKPTGIFSCECGFVYLRKGPDTTPDDHFRLSKVKVYGHVWETALRQLWYDSTISLNEIARRLQVDPITVVRQASRMELSSPRPGGKKQWKLEYRYVKRGTPRRQLSQEEYQQSWLLLMEKNPEAGRSVLQKKLPSIYAWLRRHDPEWLRAHTPVSQRRVPSSQRVDWESKDKEIAEAVKASAHRLKNTSGYPIQLTRTAIGRDIGHQKTLGRHLNKLPLTKLALSQVVETREDFAIRRILWSAHCCQEEHICPTRKQLARRVNVVREAAELPRVKEAIDVAWASLCSMRDRGYS